MGSMMRRLRQLGDRLYKFLEGSFLPHNEQRRRRSLKYKVVIGAVLTLAVVALAGYLLTDANVAVLNSKGTVADEQRSLILFAAALSLVIVVPVYVMTFWIAWKYRAGNKKAQYTPDWDRSRLLEAAWWLVPLALITLLSVITWKTSHSLDPYKPLAGGKPMTIEVVALQWKWLFIYPEQGIASVNYAQFPEDTPITFKLTSDAPMNSFWIPQLGGQIYAMSGMETKLHLQADEPGSYNGSSANISGAGFADMRFEARASTRADFDQWVTSVQSVPSHLSQAVYDNILARPGEMPTGATFASVDPALFDNIIMKYMAPMDNNPTSGGHH